MQTVENVAGRLVTGAVSTVSTTQLHWLPVRQNIKLTMITSMCQVPAVLPVKFDTYRNLQRHRAVLPAIARLSCYCSVHRHMDE